MLKQHSIFFYIGLFVSPNICYKKKVGRSWLGPETSGLKSGPTPALLHLHTIISTNTNIHTHACTHRHKHTHSLTDTYTIAISWYINTQSYSNHYTHQQQSNIQYTQHTQLSTNVQLHPINTATLQRVRSNNTISIRINFIIASHLK